MVTLLQEDEEGEEMYDEMDEGVLALVKAVYHFSNGTYIRTGESLNILYICIYI